MRNDLASRARLLFTILSVALLPPFLAGPAGAQQNEIIVQGTVLSVQNEPLAGFRVVFRLHGGADVRLSDPTSVEGEYAIPLPAGAAYDVVAVIGPGGRRIALEPAPLQVVPGARRNLIVDVSVLPDPARGGPAFAGGDRLFLSFAEDTAVVARYWGEGQFEIDDLTAGDLMVLRAVGAAQFESIPNVEFGARIGYADLDPAYGAGGGSGATDLDVWAKLRVEPGGMQHTEFGFGGLISLPVGDEATGQSFDGLRSKLFAAMRYRMEKMILAAHVGLRFNEDGEIAGIPLDGTTAASASIAAIAPLGERLALVGEAVFEGERFDSADPDARLLVGVNWKVLNRGTLRLAVAAGLADGAPDSQILAAYALDF